MSSPVRVVYQEDFALALKLWPNLFCYTALFLLATRVLLASLHFGQAKHGQKGPAATFRHFSINQRPVQARPVNDRTRVRKKLLYISKAVMKFLEVMGTI